MERFETHYRLHKPPTVGRLNFNFEDIDHRFRRLETHLGRVDNPHYVTRLDTGASRHDHTHTVEEQLVFKLDADETETEPIEILTPSEIAGLGHSATVARAEVLRSGDLGSTWERAESRLYIHDLVKLRAVWAESAKPEKGQPKKKGTLTLKLQRKLEVDKA